MRAKAGYIKSLEVILLSGFCFLAEPAFSGSCLELLSCVRIRQNGLTLSLLWLTILLIALLFGFFSTARSPTWNRIIFRLSAIAAG